MQHVDGIRIHPPPHFTHPLTLDDLVEFIRHHCIERYCLPTVLVLPNSGMHSTLPAGEHTRHSTAQHSTAQHTAASSGGCTPQWPVSSDLSPVCLSVVAHPALSGFCLRSQLTRVSVNTPLISADLGSGSVPPESQVARPLPRPQQDQAGRWRWSIGWLPND